MIFNNILIPIEPNCVTWPCAGKQQWPGVVQQRDAHVLQRAVPARLPGAGRILRQRGPARQWTGVLPGGQRPADAGPRQRPGV